MQKRRQERFEEPLEQGVVGYEIVSSKNVRNNTYKVSPSGLTKQELNQDFSNHAKVGEKDTNRHANRKEGKLVRSRPYTKSYRMLRNVASGRNSLPQ